MAKKKFPKHLFKNDHGVWYYQRKVWKGPRYKFSLETKDKAVALRERDKLNGLIAEHGFIKKSSLMVSAEARTPLFGEVAKKWAGISEGTVSETTFKHYRQYMNSLILPKFGNEPIDEIKPSDVRAFFAGLEVRDTTKRFIACPMRLVFGLAEEDSIIEFNPFDKLRGKLFNTSDRKKTNPLSLEEVGKFLQNAPEFYRPFFTIMFGTGMRLGEAAGLRWSSVNFIKNTIYIKEAFTSGKQGKTKTPGSIRELIMSSAVRDAFIEQRKRTFNKSEFVFLNKHGGQLKGTATNQVFKEALQKAKLNTNRSIKETRSSFITNALDSGETIAAVRRAVGHSSNVMIMKHYYKGNANNEVFKGSFGEAFNKSTQHIPELDNEPKIGVV